MDFNVALLQNDFRFSKTELFNRSEMYRTPWSKLPMNMMSIHMRWNYNEIIALLGPETKTFTIIRDPADQFESLFSFMELNTAYGKNLKDLISSISNNSSAKYDGIRKDGFLGRNQMAYEMGLSPFLFDNHQAVEQLIDKLGKEFHLVLIKERMEESLILLRHLLCLSMEDITSVALNARKAEHVVKLTSEERQVLRSWLAADEKIYRHFTKVFETRVAEFGASRMEEELRLHRVANGKFKNRCMVKQVGNEKLGPEKNLWVHNGTLVYLVNEYVHVFLSFIWT